MVKSIKELIEKAKEIETKTVVVACAADEHVLEAVELAEKVAKIGNENALSDAGVGAITANAAAKSAYLNVKINMGGIDDEGFKFDILTKADELLEKVNNIALQVEKEVKGKV